MIESEVAVAQTFVDVHQELNQLSSTLAARDAEISSLKKSTFLAFAETKAVELADRVKLLEAEIAGQRKRLRDIHQWKCTADNCELDGGQEHEEYFVNGGLTFKEQLQREQEGVK